MASVISKQQVTNILFNRYICQVDRKDSGSHGSCYKHASGHCV